MAEERFKLILENAINNILDDDFKTYMHEEFYKLMHKYIPYDTGNLASTLNIEYPLGYTMNDETSISIGLTSGNIDSTGITFNADYAEECYYGNKIFKQEKHPLATSNWGEIAFISEQENLINKLNEYIDRRTINE